MSLWTVITVKYTDEVSMEVFMSQLEASKFYDFTIRELLYENREVELAQSFDVDVWENPEVGNVLRDSNCWVDIRQVPSP